MKTLILLRHAKSSKDDDRLNDIDRPLNERGRNDAKLIGKYLRKQKIHADLVIGSPAKRAKQTMALVLKSAGLKLEPKFDERIYEASGRRLLKVITQIEDSVNSALMVGHNPGFEELLESLTGEAPSLPTASLACIELDCEQWNKVRDGTGELKWRVTPKKLRGG